MRHLNLRAEQLARTAQRRRLAAIAARIEDEITGVAVDIGDAEIALSGKGLARRWLVDPALRFLTGAPR